MKLKIQPDATTKRYFNRVIGISRYFYNKSIELYNGENKPKTNFYDYRKILMPGDKQLKGTDKEWQTLAYYDTRQLMIKEAIGMIKSATSNLKNGNIKNFKMKFRSRKNIRQSFHIDIKHIKKYDQFI